MNISTCCKSVLVATAAVLVLAGNSAGAAELKLGHFMSPGHIMHQELMAPWAAEIARLTGNQLTVRIFPASQLGGKPPTQYKLAVDGIADIAFGLPGFTSSQFPRTTLVELPGFASTGVDATKKIWDVFDRVLAGEYRGVKVLALWTNDTAAYMSKSKPIRRFEDLKGLRVRVPSTLQGKLVEHFGGQVVNMPPTEIYNALDRGVIDVIMIPMSAVVDFKFFEIAKYYTVGAPVSRSPFFLVMNQKKYESLPPDQKAAIDNTTGRSLSLRAAASYDKRGEDAIAQVRKIAGVEIIQLSADEIRRWQANIQRFVEAQLSADEKKGIPARAIFAGK